MIRCLAQGYGCQLPQALSWDPPTGGRTDHFTSIFNSDSRARAIRIWDLSVGVVVVLVAAGHAAKDWLLALARLLAPALAAIVALVLLQGVTTGQWGFATAPRVLTLARWIADGPADAYLREECPTRHFAICDYLDDLPQTAVHIVFGAQSIVNRMGGPLAAGPEAEAVLLGTAMRHPLWVVQVMAVQGWKQLWRFETGTHLVPMVEANRNGWAARAIKQHVASSYAAYLAARQVADDLHLASFRTVDRLVAWSSLALLPPLLLVFARRRDMVMVYLILATGSGLAINAVICGANSMPVDRFQARVIWLAVFAVLVGVVRLAAGDGKRQLGSPSAPYLRPGDSNRISWRWRLSARFDRLDMMIGRK